ncbi:intradiol ring-cleavage dioxygenase [Nocardioides albus]|uniref:Protocatechuate 3,4-dioxygenase beta subunit n=1 Tax=Nocardioides albus TaxID=1841 RepID=A0A7W5A5U4_9ACTN|nr:intradiol ring-cleavage dioxygenase [Nocardioides albus]MBB3089945.1 protocatechuate 3,4-dioxygenase beta subunit [Nocardioides albus]GGU36734.1 3,4-dioxygenase subunit beta [Nocardioides albus]
MSRVPEPENTPRGPAFEGRLLARPEEEVVDQGAGFDISTLLSRRRILGLVGAGVGAAALAACGAGSSSSSGSSAGSAATTPSTTDGEIPQETNGPYPADGTNGTNVLTESGIVRSDITSSLDGGTTVDGVPLEFTFTVTDMANDNVPFEGVAVYLWQCDALGRYSMYSEGVEDETYLRGVQVADAAGQVRFKTIVPGCYDGRWTHMHFEVYPDAASATTGENAIATSQVAFPEKMLAKVYQDAAYEGSTENLNRVSLETDNVFSDGYDLEMGTFTGSPSAGYRGSLAVAVDTTTEATMGGAPGGGGPGGTPPEPPTR